MWERCRFCGSKGSRPFVVRAGETLCPACAGSPLCDQCGHPREAHRAVFRSGRPSCAHEWFDHPSLSRVACACTGFRPVTGTLGDASFAEPTDDGLEGLRIA